LVDFDEEEEEEEGAVVAAADMPLAADRRGAIIEAMSK
jgi:hypothetical protein